MYGSKFLGSDFPGVMPARLHKCVKLRIVRVIGYISIEKGFIPSVHKLKHIPRGPPSNGPLSSYLEIQAGDWCKFDRVQTSSHVLQRAYPSSQ